MSLHLRTSSSILLCGLSLGAQGTAPDAGRFYVGLTVGSQRTDIVRPGQTTRTPLERGTAAIIGGMRFGPTWGGELGLHVLGGYPAGTTTDAYGTTDWKRQVHGLSLTGTGQVHLGRRVALYGQAGVMLWSAEPRSHESGWVTVTDGRDHSRNGGTPLLAAGLDLALGAHWDFRLEASVADRIMDARMTRASAGVIYRF